MNRMCHSTDCAISCFVSQRIWIFSFLYIYAVISSCMFLSSEIVVCLSSLLGSSALHQHLVFGRELSQPLGEISLHLHLHLSSRISLYLGLAPLSYLYIPRISCADSLGPRLALIRLILAHSPRPLKQDSSTTHSREHPFWDSPPRPFRWVTTYIHIIRANSQILTLPSACTHAII